MKADRITKNAKKSTLWWVQEENGFLYVKFVKKVAL